MLLVLLEEVIIHLAHGHALMLWINLAFDACILVLIPCLVSQTDRSSEIPLFCSCKCLFLRRAGLFAVCKSSESTKSSVYGGLSVVGTAEIPMSIDCFRNRSSLPFTSSIALQELVDPRLATELAQRHPRHQIRQSNTSSNTRSTFYGTRGDLRRCRRPSARKRPVIEGGRSSIRKRGREHGRRARKKKRVSSSTLLANLNRTSPI